MKKKKILSPAKKRFAEEVAKTKDVKTAALNNLPAGPAQFPHQIEEKGHKLIKNSKEVRQTILEVWEAEGLTLSLATKRHLNVLKSPKSRGADTLKAADMVYRGHGLKTTDSPGETSINPLIKIFIEQRQARGLPMPEGIVEAEVIPEGEK